MSATPVVLLVFNRPQPTADVLDAIRRVRPERLYVIGDGPRPDRTLDREKCVAVRNLIAERVDWPCQVRTNFSEVNLGCARRVSSGIDWVFEQEEQALFLEDDCVPDPVFFRYCAELLDRYRSDPRIGMVSGCNFKAAPAGGRPSYFLSAYNFIWGWATWRHAWALFDRSMAKWPRLRSTPWLRRWLRSRPAAAYWQDRFNETHEGRIDSWAYAWTFSLWAHAKLTLLPATNLVTNIGFGPDATHPSEADRRLSRAASSLDFPLRHPQAVRRDMRADHFFERHVFRIGWKYVAKRWVKRLLLRRS